MPKLETNTKWLSISWKGQIVDIDGKGNMRLPVAQPNSAGLTEAVLHYGPKSQKDACDWDVRKPTSRKRKNRKTKVQSKDAKKKQGFARNIDRHRWIGL